MAELTSDSKMLKMLLRRYGRPRSHAAGEANFKEITPCRNDSSF